MHNHFIINILRIIETTRLNVYSWNHIKLYEKRMVDFNVE